MNTRELQNALVLLGDTPYAVAASLAKAGIRGRQLSCRHCPIANYLSKISGMEFMVGKDKACALNYLAPDNFSLPLACQEFIRDFDGEAFPDLLEI